MSSRWRRRSSTKQARSCGSCCRSTRPLSRASRRCAMALRSKIGARASTTLPRLPEARVADILERSAVQSGTPFENGLAGAVAADLCRGGPCRAIDLQIVGAGDRRPAPGVAAALPAQRRRGRVAGGLVRSRGGRVGRRAGAPGDDRRGDRGHRHPRRAGGARAQRARSRRRGARGAACARPAGWRRPAAARSCSRSRTRRLPTSCSSRRWPIARAPTWRGGRCCADARPASGCACGELYAISRDLRGALAADERRAVFRSVRRRRPAARSGGGAGGAGGGRAVRRHAPRLHAGARSARRGRRRAHRRAARSASSLSSELHPQSSAARRRSSPTPATRRPGSRATRSPGSPPAAPPARSTRRRRERAAARTSRVGCARC